MLRVLIGAKVAEVLQLDCAEVCQGLGVSCETRSSRYIEVSGDLQRFRDELQDMLAPGWDHPPGYREACKRALKRLDRVVGG